MTRGKPAIAPPLPALPEHVAPILEAMTDGLWICDATPRLLWINRACETLNDIRRHDVCGRRVDELLAAGNFDHDATTQVLATRRPVAINQRVRSGRELLVNAVPVFDGQGAIAYVVGTERDLTELNQVRSELDATREITRKISSELLALKLRDARLGEVVAESESMERVLDTALKLAQFDSTVLLTGPSGTGKSLLAKIIHEHSPRASSPLLSLNCGALPGNLLEAELFGYAPGAFTGAQPGGKPGLVEAASGGTLFLDEIDALPLEVQVKLLTFLDTQSFIRVGDTRLRQVDVRLLAATNRDLLAHVHDGRFREDLLFRLNVVPIHITPLRERPEDIPALVHKVLAELNARYAAGKTIDRDALDLVCRYELPGNVRELRNLLERAFVLSEGERITPADLPRELRGQPGPASPSLPPPGSLDEALRAAELRLLEGACRRHRRQVDVGRELGVSQATVARLLKRHGLSLSR